MGIRNERGIALPVTIFIVTLLTITLAAAFARVDAERSIAVGTSDAVNALQVAQSGLRRYMESLTTRPANGDSARYNVTGGYADVRAWMVQRPANPLANQMYVVRSTGYAIEPTAGATPQGVRTVAQFGYWQTPRVRLLAALTAANGIRARNPGGGNIRVRADDQCSLTLGIPSVRAAVGSNLNFGNYTSISPIIAGAGPILADTTGIQWAAMIGGGFVPNYNGMQTGVWDWGSHFVQGDATLSDAWGTGLLVVSGNLTTAGSSALWYGIVLVGGELIFNSTHSHFNGIVITGLREQLTGAPPPMGDIGGNGGSRYHIDYWSCYVDATLANLTGFIPVQNAWVDNWPSY